jgi:hypothetical protein
MNFQDITDQFSTQGKTLNDRWLDVDKVYEFCFYPLQGGFKANPEKDFELIDQWTEIVPTDQIVPVPVEYDPKTGRQK